MVLKLLSDRYAKMNVYEIPQPKTLSIEETVGQIKSDLVAELEARDFTLIDDDGAVRGPYIASILANRTVSDLGLKFTYSLVFEVNPLKTPKIHAQYQESLVSHVLPGFSMFSETGTEGVIRLVEGETAKRLGILRRQMTDIEDYLIGIEDAVTLGIFR